MPAGRDFNCVLVSGLMPSSIKLQWPPFYVPISMLAVMHHGSFPRSFMCRHQRERHHLCVSVHDVAARLCSHTWTFVLSSCTLLHCVICSENLSHSIRPSPGAYCQATLQTWKTARVHDSDITACIHSHSNTSLDLVIVFSHQTCIIFCNTPHGIHIFVMRLSVHSSHTLHVI